MKIIGIMACDPRGVIGKDNKIPWSYQEDFRFFNQQTYNQVMIMGRKTFESIPQSILSNRFNIVFSKTMNPSFLGNTIFVRSLEDFLELREIPDKKYYMVGGKEIARLFLEENLISEFLLTKINLPFQGDVLFPLELLENYPCTIIKRSADFTIYKYSLNKKTNNPSFS